MNAHDETPNSLTERSLPRTRACAGADLDLDQDQGSNPLGTDVAVNPSSLPQSETFANLDEVRRETEDKFHEVARATIAQWRETARDLQEQNNELARDRDLADREVRRLRKEADLLRRELQEVRENDPKSRMIREVLDHWLVTLGKSSRTKCPANGARWNKVRARLNDGFTVDQLKAAVDGCALVPFVGPKGRQELEGAGAKRFDDIELICRDETSVERFIGYRKSAPQLAPAVFSGPLGVVLGRLAKFTADGPDRFGARCPSCDERDGSLCVRQVKTDEGEYVALDCYVGCTEGEVADALGVGMHELVSTEGMVRGRVAPLPEHLRVAVRMLMARGESELAA